MKFVKKLGIAQLPVLIGLLIMMVALPVASNLVQEEQDTRKGASYGVYDCGVVGQQCCYEEKEGAVRLFCQNNLSCDSQTNKCVAGVIKDCERCSSNFGCQRAYFKTYEDNCEYAAAIPDTTTYKRDCTCPERHLAGGGNDNECDFCKTWYFCLREDDDNGHVYVSYVDSGKDNESDCEKVARSYGGDAYPGTQYERGDVTGLCVQDPDLCNDSLLHQFYKCSGSACVESDLHFDKDSCTRALKFWANKNNEIIGSHSICFSNNTCKDGDIECPSDKPKVSCYFNGKTYNEGEVFCTNCLNGTGNSCVGKCNAKSDGTDGGVIDFDYESCSSKGLICQSGSCVKNDSIYLHYCDSKGNVAITGGTYTNDASGIAECESFYGTKCERDGNDLNCKKPVEWYYCDGTQLTCKVDTNSYVDSASCSRAHGGRTCYLADAKVYCDSVCAKADYMYYCGNNGCEKSDEKFVSLTECNNVVGKDCYETSSDCEKKCIFIPIDTSCTDYEGNKIDNNLTGCSRPDLISTCRNAQWSNASGDFVSCESDERCSDGECRRVYCYGNDGKPTAINTTGCVTESSLATCQIDSTTRSARWVGQEACTYGCENGQCKEKPIVDPCDSKNCSWGCVNGKCKCNLNGTNYLSGERACNTGNTAVNECNDGNWNYNVDICSSNEVCRNGKCELNDVKTCQNWDKTVVSVGYSGCPEKQAVGYCTINGWFGQSACGTGRVCVNGKCVTDSQPKNCTSDTNQTIVAGSSTRFCYNGSVYQCDIDGNYIPKDLCMYGCVNGICNSPPQLNQCTDHYGNKVDANDEGCSNVFQVSKCQDDGEWSIKSSDITNCGVDERCWNGKCEKIVCEGYENASPINQACKTSDSVGTCIRNSEGLPQWISVIKCSSGECKDGKCVNDEVKCTQCTTVAGNKGKGDADCDGKVTLNDWALWFKEFDSGKGTEQKKTWLADFNCDGKVDNSDLDIWFTSYLNENDK
jgi:hypothetical protein